jgi:hypothetical protein
VITEEQAREIVRCRLEEASRTKGPTPLRVFAREMYMCGLAKRVPSIPLLSRLFAGDVYPNLCDADGTPFDWAKIPRAFRGRRRLPSRKVKLDLRAVSDELVRLGSIVREICERIGVEGYEPPTRARLQFDPVDAALAEAEEEQALDREEIREVSAIHRSTEPPTELRMPERAPAEPGDGTTAALTLDDFFDTPPPPPPQATPEPTMHVIERGVPPPRRA